MVDKPKRSRGRPSRSMPEQIPDTPENVARALLNTPPKHNDEWDYMKDNELRGEGDSNPR